MANNIRVELTQEEMVQAVRKVFKEENADLMSACIVDVLYDNGNAMESFFKATMGITPTHDYFVGNKVWCDSHGLMDWKFDTVKMEEEGILKDGGIIAKIIKVRPFNQDKPYVVEYKYIDKETGKMKITKSDVNYHYVKGIADEVFPGE
jgi:hypothetical protein